MARAIIAASVDPDVAAALRRRAAAGDRTVSAEIRRALRSHLKNGDGPSPEAAAQSSAEKGPSRGAD